MFTNIVKENNKDIAYEIKMSNIESYLNNLSKLDNKIQQLNNKYNHMISIYNEARDQRALDIMFIIINLDLNINSYMALQLKKVYDSCKSENKKFYKSNKQNYDIYADIDKQLKKYYIFAKTMPELLNCYNEGENIDEIDYYNFCKFVTTSDYTKNDKNKIYYIECKNYLNKYNHTFTNLTNISINNNYIFSSNPIMTFEWLVDIEYTKNIIKLSNFNIELNQAGGKYHLKYLKYNQKINKLQNNTK